MPGRSWNAAEMCQRVEKPWRQRRRKDGGKPEEAGLSGTISDSMNKLKENDGAAVSPELLACLCLSNAKTVCLLEMHSVYCSFLLASDRL